MSDYNYENFATEGYDFETSSGPQIGDIAPDVAVHLLDGSSHRVLDINGPFLVLEFGSLTCPLFQGRRAGMSLVQHAYPELVHVVVYVREAHPGEKIPAHQNQADKTACARRLADDMSNVSMARQVWVDDFEGQVHQAFGGMPNAVFILDASGHVRFRSEWNNPVATKAVLDKLMNGLTVQGESYFRPVSPRIAIDTLRNAGPGAVVDFLKGLPFLIWTNLIKRNLRLLFR